MTIEILAYEETSLGLLCLRRRELLSRPGTSVTEVTLNHEFLMSSYLTESERELTRIGLRLLTQPTPNRTDIRVLVGGLGLGFTANEALDDPHVSKVEVVEFLPQVIQWVDDGLVPLSATLTAARGSRLAIIQGDIYARLLAQPVASYDLIVIDVDHSPADVLGPQSQDFYSEIGLQAAAAHLLDQGVLGIWSYAEDSPLVERMKCVLDDVQVHQVTVWNDLIDEPQTDWLVFGRRKQVMP